MNLCRDMGSASEWDGFWERQRETKIEKQSQCFHGIFDECDNLGKYSMYYYDFHKICNAFHKQLKCESACECMFRVSVSFSRSSFKWKILWKLLSMNKRHRIYKTTRSTMWLIIKIDALVLYICTLKGQNNKRGTHSKQYGYVLNTLAFTIAQIIK